ncbi:MAG: hypothetical protein ACYDAI_02560 [Trichloromonadaceae bacterium]
MTHPHPIPPQKIEVAPLLLVGDLAGLLRRSVRSIRHDLARRNWDRVPQPVRCGRQLYWKQDAVRAWMAALGQPQEKIVEQPPRRRPGRPRKA